MEGNVKEFVDNLIKNGVNIAVFDVDNTITRSNVLGLLIFIKSKQYSKIKFFIYPVFIY